MRRVSLAAAWVASTHLVFLSANAFAQQPQPVQPVPYSTSQPVPYGQPAPQPVPAPTYAPAPVAPGGDTVVLKNGGMIRGTLIEILPNDHATVQLPNGTSAIVQWSEIHHIERAAAPAPAPVPTGPAPLPSSAPPPKITGPTILVHIDSTRRVSLMRRAPENGEWITACESPCDMQLPLNNEYRIAGSGVTQSSEFDLDGQPGQRVVIKANVGTTAGLTGGLIITGVGLLVAIVGLYVIAGAAAVNSVSCVNGKDTSTGASCSTSGGGVAVGVVLVLGGVAAMGIGGVIALINWKTGQSQEVQVPKANAKAALVDFDAYKRAPVWHEPLPMPGGLPRTTEIPIFSKSF